MKTCALRPAIGLLAGTLLTACSNHQAPGALAGLPLVAVRVATVRLEDMPGLTEVAGTVRPLQHAMIAAKVMGAIEELPVTLGQHVRAGDLLAKISAGEISARMLQAQSQLNQARRDLERERSLLAKGASTPDMVKSMEDRFAMTQAMVSEAEVMLGYTTILAPFDGVVARRLANAGDLALPGMPLLEVEGTGDFQVETGIPDSLAARLAVGASLTVEIPATGASFEGRLVELSSAADPLTHTVPAKLSVPAATVVRSGQFARVQVPGTPVRTLLVPATAVTTFGQMERVFAVEDGRAGLRLVKTGAARREWVEILAGLADGDRIVVDPPAGLREGQPLEIQP